jgi:hypothetical protein
MQTGATQMRSVRRPRRSISGTAAMSMTKPTQLRVRSAEMSLWQVVVRTYSLGGDGAVEWVGETGHRIKVRRIGPHDRHADGHLPVPREEGDDKSSLKTTSDSDM